MRADGRQRVAKRIGDSFSRAWAWTNLGFAILVTEATRRLLADGASRLKARGSTPVKGRREEIAIYAV